MYSAPKIVVNAISIDNKIMKDFDLSLNDLTSPIISKTILAISSNIVPINDNKNMPI